MKRCVILIFICLALLLCACSAKSVSHEFFAMDTVMQLTAYGAHAADALADAEAEVYRLEALLSCQDAGAELARCNAGQRSVSEETAQLVRTALAFSDATGGAYDPTLGVVSQTWGFGSGEAHVPEAEALTALLAHTGADKVQLDGSDILLTDGVQLDLGGIAKGYAAGCIRTILQDAGVSSAIVSLGGNIAVVGTKPSGEDWQIGLQDPANPDACFGVVSVSDACVVTSGSYQRFFESNGVRYHHILNPQTGYPAESGLLSVSVIAQDDAMADALSTALFVMGLDAGAAFQKAGTLPFEAVFVTTDGSVYITAGLTERYRSDRPYQVLA